MLLALSLVSSVLLCALAATGTAARNAVRTVAVTILPCRIVPPPWVRERSFDYFSGAASFDGSRQSRSVGGAPPTPACTSRPVSASGSRRLSGWSLCLGSCTSLGSARSFGSGGFFRGSFCVFGLRPISLPPRCSPSRRELATQHVRASDVP